MKKFRIMCAAATVAATALGAQAMTPIPRVIVVDTPLLADDREGSSDIPARLNEQLLGKVFLGTKEQLCERSLLRLYGYETKGACFGLVINVRDAGAPNELPTTYFATYDSEWRLIDGARVAGPTDGADLLALSLGPRGNEDVSPLINALERLAVGVKVTRGYEERMFLADVGTQRWVNELTSTFVMDEQGRIAVEHNATGKIITPPHPPMAVMPGKEPEIIPGSTSVVTAQFGDAAVDYIKALSTPLSHGSQLAQWAAVGTALSAPGEEMRPVRRDALCSYGARSAEMMQRDPAAMMTWLVNHGTEGAALTAAIKERVAADASLAALVKAQASALKDKAAKKFWKKIVK